MEQPVVTIRISKITGQMVATVEGIKGKECQPALAKILRDLADETEGHWTLHDDDPDDGIYQFDHEVGEEGQQQGN